MTDRDSYNLVTASLSGKRLHKVCGVEIVIGCSVVEVIVRMLCDAVTRSRRCFYANSLNTTFHIVIYNLPNDIWNVTMLHHPLNLM